MVEVKSLGCFRETDEVHAHVLRTWAAHETAFADVLARVQPEWGSTTFPLADGVAVLCGPGMYVNAAMAVGLRCDVSPLIISDEFDVFEARCAAVGVEPAVEMSPFTRSAVASAVAERGYVKQRVRTALRRRLDNVDRSAAVDHTLIIEPGARQLDVWQETSASGWGHDTPASRQVSDAYAQAAAEVDGDGFMLVRDATTGQPIACAGLTICDDVATLGGMSTVPTARRRGVQAALIQHRLRIAAEAGCTIATSTTTPSSDSARNLVRHGFETWFDIETLVRQPSV